MSDMYTPDPFIPTITFADDTVINGSGSINFDHTYLCLWPSGDLLFAEYFRIFNNSEKTSSIKCINSSTSEETYFGYTFLTDIRRSPDGRVTVMLKKPPE